MIYIQPMTQKNIIIASDHAGFELKTVLTRFLQEKGYTVDDLGTNSADSVDYPDFGDKAAKAILDGKAPWGIIICGTGIGISIAANRHKGIRAAVAVNPQMATLARQHNNANLLALGARLVTPEQAIHIVSAFIDADFEGGRHQRRIDKLDNSCC